MASEPNEWRRTQDAHNNLVWVKQTPDDELRMDFTLVAGYLNALEADKARAEERLQVAVKLLRQVPDMLGAAYACWAPEVGMPEVDAFEEELSGFLAKLDADPT